jgi:hypothetical protein
MTRCVACDKNLNNYESTRKDLHGHYLDMCNTCYRSIRDDLPTIAREDLSPLEEVEPEETTNPEWDEVKLE